MAHQGLIVVSVADGGMSCRIQISLGGRKSALQPPSLPAPLIVMGLGKVLGRLRTDVGSSLCPVRLAVLCFLGAP